MKTGDLTIVYGIVALLSVLLAVFYLLWDKKRDRLFLALFGCVAAVNCGYFLLSVCRSLTVARLANGLSYFGTAFSILVMLLIIYEVCQIRQRKWFKGLLVGISTAAFALAASGDWKGLYYISISLETVNGMTRLVKEYGPLHILYTLYLVLYLLLMIAIIAYAAKKQRLHSPKYAMFLFMSVFLNFGVWAAEQAIDVDFEFLSVSYVVTEVSLLLIYGVLCDYGIIHPETGMVSVQMLTQLNTLPAKAGELPSGMEELFDSFAKKVSTLTSAEHRIFNYYMDGYEISEIPDLAFISIHTVKKHNRSIYQKLEIASRDELMLYIELFRCCNRLEELTGEARETDEVK